MNKRQKKKKQAAKNKNISADIIKAMPETDSENQAENITENISEHSAENTYDDNYDKTEISTYSANTDDSSTEMPSDKNDEEIITDGFDSESISNQSFDEAFNNDNKNNSSAFLLPFFNRIFLTVASLGYYSRISVEKIFEWIFLSLKNPAVKFLKFIKRLFLILASLLKRTLFASYDDIKALNKDNLRFLKTLHIRHKKTNESYSLLTEKYLKYSHKKHKKTFHLIFNNLLPILTVILVLIIINTQSGKTVALEVSYNGQNIGYIENEDTFTTARNTLYERMNIGSDNSAKTSDVKGLISDPKYKIKYVSYNQLSDSSELCKNIIYNSQSNLTNACGIYIDGDFLCAVKNETDASSVFNAILEKYKKNNYSSSENVIVNFVEDVSFADGRYPDNQSVIWSVKQLEKKLNSIETVTKTYKVKKGDSIYTICKRFNMTEYALRTMNPKLKSNLSVDSKLIVADSGSFVQVQISKTEVKTKSIKYSTEKVETNNLYSGDSSIIQKGENGQKKVTQLVTYINGVKVNTQEISSKITKQPTTEIIQIGTKASDIKIFNTGEGDFIWPAVGLHMVTSTFGYRNTVSHGTSLSGYHKGIDISGSNASGKPVIASAAGTVIKVEYDSSGYGNMILIDHGNGIQTRYGHLLDNSILVNVGDTVVQSQQIASVGSTGRSTGPHLHFEIIYNGTNINPLDYIS